MFSRYLLIAVVAAISLHRDAAAQSDVAAEPIVGLRDNRPRNYAFQHAEVVVRPGHRIADATVLVQGTSITAVAAAPEIPPGFMTIDCSGKCIYPGLIDAWSEADVPGDDSGAAYWNSHITPQRRAAVLAAESIDNSEKLRSQGFAIRVIAPRGGIVKGSSCVVLLTDSAPGRRLLKEDAWQHLQLTVPRGASRSRYPNSPMGAVALLRQSMYDATWYQSAWDAYRARPDLPRPETNLALDVLSRAIRSQWFVVDAPNERMAVRANKIAREFALKIILRGSGREYRNLEEIAGANRPVLVPVDFPEKPNVTTSQLARNVTLQELMHWDQAPANPARLAAAGVTICLTTDGLEKIGDFRVRVRKAIDRGLDRDAALAALTTVPARLLGIEGQAGSVQAGQLANLVITDGDLFAEETTIEECWVAGQQFVVTPPADDRSWLVGNWMLTFRAAESNVSLRLELEEKDDKLLGRLRDAVSDDEAETVQLKQVVVQRDRMTATADLSAIDLSRSEVASQWTPADRQLTRGVSQLTIMRVMDHDGATRPLMSITLPGGEIRHVTLRPIETEDEAISGDQPAEEQDESDDGDQTGDEDVAEDSDDGDQTNDEHEPERQAWVSPTLVPLGAYGRERRMVDQPTVMFRGGTVWTCDDGGVLENADVLIRDGLIAAVGQGLAVPGGCQIIDTRGKHITPGLIDCHSHMGTDGGVNESGQAVTAECRIGDFIDNSDIQIYRQAAGGLTTSNILHGSANPIGGQNQVIKLRWGETMDGLRMTQAPPGIKFALGENVKRNQSRYPNTRMGVEQIIRDQLLAAREYQTRWRHWREGSRDRLPPRIDLQLEALAEVQRGQRWIHCHSYRQDEIAATLDLLEEFGIQIGTLQHILEGYKVADRMARHGAMGSAFSDWWAYKFEVYDAIPYNGALMHDRGVVVSFNSDDRELARHLNTEAAKATKYGNVPEVEALKFVTLNPAKQLRIDTWIGSITVGKHADLVVWSGRPLSTLSRCEQTWIDGRRYFDLQADQQLRQRDARLRARLIQKALADDGAVASPDSDDVAEEDRWVRHDVYCATHGAAKHQQGGRR